jgi:hypothetical protein
LSAVGRGDLGSLVRIEPDLSLAALQDRGRKAVSIKGIKVIDILSK